MQTTIIWRNTSLVFPESFCLITSDKTNGKPRPSGRGGGQLRYLNE